MFDQVDVGNQLTRLLYTPFFRCAYLGGLLHVWRFLAALYR
nr:hypothetical protein [Pseudomonas aeruginosa]